MPEYYGHSHIEAMLALCSLTGGGEGRLFMQDDLLCSGKESGGREKSVEVSQVFKIKAVEGAAQWGQAMGQG